MTKMVHPILGAVDPSNPGFWEADVAFRGRIVIVDLTIEDSGVPASALQKLPASPADFEPLDREARAAILADALSDDDDAASVLYLTHHHEQFSPQDYQRIFGASAPDLDNPEPLLSRLALVRVGLYPEHADRQILLDYSIDPDATNYLLCVSFDAARHLIAVDLES